MKWILSLLMVALLAGAGGAIELSGHSNFAVAAADTGAVKHDTTTSQSMDLREFPVGTKYFMAVLQAQRRNLAFSNDSLTVFLQGSVDRSVWESLDSSTIAFNTSANDTTASFGPILVDSTLVANFLRARFVRSHTLTGTGADTTVGKTYRQQQAVWLLPRY